MEIPAGYLKRSEQRAMVDQSPGYQVNNFALAFQHPVNPHQPRAQQLPALPIAQVAPDHNVDAAGFILKRDEYDA